MTDCDYFNPTSLWPRVASSQHGGCEMDVLVCALIFGVTILA